MDTDDFGSHVGEAAAATPEDAPAPWADPERAGGASDGTRQANWRLLASGAASLSHEELVGLVLGGAARGDRVMGVARRIVRRHGLEGMGRLGPRQWRSERGVGPAAAARLTAVFELGRRLYLRDADDRPRISSPRDAWRQVRHLGRARKEHLVGLYLDAQNALAHRETVSVGSLNTTRTHPREILHPAVVHLALGFILAHNHPSGCPDPSTEDVEFTRSIRRAGELMGIELYDHLIVTGRGYTSLRERGLL